MRTPSRSWRSGLLIAAASLSLLAFGGARSARAACSMPGPSGRASGGASFLPAVYRTDSGSPGSLLQLVDDRDGAAIVGLWKFEMLAKSTATNTNPMPDGAVVDFGVTAWHSDHTEIMNSGARNPADGDFCQGVWKQVGPATFRLNHIAIAWGGGSYVGPAQIQFLVTVDPTGNHYAGKFTLTQYVATITPGHEFDENAVAVRITGTVTATRLTAN
ncbi:MAG: hypothetical protein KGL36_02340 [Gammaproteobacteria bacterium]|nr:hypothetical protein [Gammaproteobacteria bacterium]